MARLSILNYNTISSINDMLPRQLILSMLHLQTNWLIRLPSFLLLMRLNTFTSSWDLPLNLVYL
jgi:hypothetical protein